MTLGLHEVAGEGPIHTPSGPAGLTMTLGTAGDNIEGWYPLKTLWVAAGGYDGPALVRGARLDAAGDVRFSYSAVEPDGRFRGREVRLAPELRFPAGDTGVSAAGYGAGARYFPSYTHVRTPGCYAWQVDGPDFSYVMVFLVSLTAGE